MKTCDHPVRYCPRNAHVFLLVLSTWLAAWPCHWAKAVPAFPGLVEVTQPDGSRIQLRARGDEFFSWHETEEGYAVVKDSADGFWMFAQPAADRAEFRAITAARVGVADPAGLGLLKRALPNAALLRDYVQEQQQTVLGEQPIELPVPDVVPSAPPPEGPPPDEPPRPISVSETKTVKNIVILAAFSDHWGSDTVNPSFGRVDTSEYANLFNQANHSTDGAVGSVRDYYKEVSYGKLTIESVVTVWVQLPNTEAYYATGNPDPHAQEMVRDAIDAADTAGFDFSQGDSDGDGWVDCLTILHSGYGQEYGNPLPDVRIWSHKGSLGSTIGTVTKDNVKMYPYHTEPALRGGTGSTSIIRIGVICHELGHFFGLPDLYDYSDTTEGLGSWCEMAGGSWNGSDGKRPAHFSAWCKVFLGFVNPFPVHSLAGLSLARVEDNAVVGMLRDGMSNGEYYLIENRANTGFDNDAEIYPGLLIHHVDSKSGNNDLNSWSHPLVKIEEADGNDSLGSKTAASQAGDVWTSTSGLAGGFRDLTGNQSANAMLYQATHDYNRSDDSAYYSYNRLNNFSAAGSTMTFDATTLRTTVGYQTVASSDYTVSWQACSEATNYEIQEGAKATLTSFSDGAEDEDAMYNDWHNGGAVQRDSGGAHEGSYSYSMLASRGSVQSLTQQKQFKVTASTVVSFYVMSHISSGNGSIKCQISADSGDTWLTLSTDTGYINTWASRSYNYAALHALGIAENDMCILRFIVDIERASGWDTFPAWGFAVDDITITGVEIDGYVSWTTLASDVAATSYDVSGQSHGIHAYRVRAYANNVWQDYGTEGEVTVNNAPVAADLTLAAAKNGSATFPLGKYGRDPDGDALSVSFSGLSPGDQASYADGTITYTPASDVTGDRTFTYTLTDAYGASVSRTITATVSAAAGSAGNILSASYNAGTATITFAGIPGATYTLQYTEDLITWNPVVDGTVTLPAMGQASAGKATVTQSSAPATAYYRTVYVSGP